MAARPCHSLGKFGEDVACTELVRRGYVILERRYRNRHGEIDVIARVDRTLVFIEVKARAGQAFGDGAAAVTAQKRRRIVRMAEEFLARRQLVDVACRFDVVAVDLGGRRPRVVVYPHAFTA